MISSERIGRKGASTVFNDAVSYLDLTASVGRFVKYEQQGEMKDPNNKLNFYCLFFLF